MYIASMVLGIVSIVFCWVPVLNIILALTGLGLSIASFIKMRKLKTSNGMTITGLVLSIISTIISFFMIVGFLVFALNIGEEIVNNIDRKEPYYNINTSYMTLDCDKAQNAITSYIIKNSDKGISGLKLVSDGIETDIVNKSSDIEKMSNSIKERIAVKGNRYYKIKSEILEDCNMRNLDNDEIVVDSYCEVYINKKIK